MTQHIKKTSALALASKFRALRPERTEPPAFATTPREVWEAMVDAVADTAIPMVWAERFEEVAGRNER